MTPQETNNECCPGCSITCLGCKCHTPQETNTVRVFGRLREISKSEYAAIHYWLRKHHGPATSCQNAYCTRKSVTFEWALRRDKQYERVRENFIQLCKSCHGQMDVTDHTRRTLHEKNKGKKPSELNRQRTRERLTGRPHSAETKRKHSLNRTDRRPVAQIKNGEEVASFVSVREAARTIGTLASSIVLAIQKNQKCSGFNWSYKTAGRV